MSGKDTQASEKTPPTLSLRLAEASNDLDLLRPLIAEFHQASHFSGVPLSQAKIEAMFAEAVARPDRYAVIIAEYDRRAIGFLYCFAGEYVGGAEALVTTIHTYFVAQKYRHSLLGGRTAARLLKAAIRWSEIRKVREVILHVTSGIDLDRTDRFVRKAGFRLFGTNYALRLDGA